MATNYELYLSFRSYSLFIAPLFIRLCHFYSPSPSFCSSLFWLSVLVASVTEGGTHNPYMLYTSVNAGHCLLVDWDGTNSILNCLCKRSSSFWPYMTSNSIMYILNVQWDNFLVFTNINHLWTIYLLIPAPQSHQRRLNTRKSINTFSNPPTIQSMVYIVLDYHHHRPIQSVFNLAFHYELSTHQELLHFYHLLYWGWAEKVYKW